MEEFDGVVFPDFTEYDKNLILHGAGINGAICAFALKELGVQFLCFCDNDSSKQNMEYIGYPVYSPEECARRFPGAAVLLDVYCSGEDIERFSALGYGTILFPASLFLNLDCESAAAFITEQLGRGDEGYAFREAVDAYQVYEWIDEYMVRGVGYVNNRREISRAVNLDLTDRCTLRCKNCLALKPYFKDRSEMSWEQMEQVIDKLLALRWFRRFHLLGGEPFLYPHLDKVLTKLCASPEVEHVNIITNGTVLPEEPVLQALENPKTMVRVSYYGDLSKRYRELEKICQERNIQIRVHAQKWADIGRALDHASNLDETQKRYNGCSQRTGSFFYVMHGQVTICPFAANTHALGLYQAEGGDVVDVLSETQEPMIDRLTALYWRQEPLTACYYCNGWLPYATKPVPVAVQYQEGERPILPTYRDGTK